jgi:type IV fimbrial biogenesis protein FimT
MVNRERAAAGFTLIEALIVVALMAILTALALPSFTGVIARNRTKAAASDLQTALFKARSEALKRNANTTISPVSASWQNGWQVLDAGSSVIESYPAPQGVTIASAPASVVYQSSGRINATSAPTFQVTSSGNVSMQRCVLLSTNGRPYVKEGAC